MTALVAVMIPACSSTDAAQASAPDAGGDTATPPTGDAGADAPRVVGHCEYHNAFSGQDDCKTYTGATWTAASASAACVKVNAIGGTFVPDTACSSSTYLGDCVVSKGDGLDTDTRLGGTSDMLCSDAKLACETFAQGTFVASWTCANPSGEGHEVFVWPSQSCVDPKPGEPAGASDGKVCTYNLISACTEDGRDYRDYVSCSDIYTNRPYYPATGRPIADASDPRRSDAAYVAESSWVKRQTKACACVCCHSSAAPDGPSAWSISDDPLWVDSISDKGVAMFAGKIDSSALGAFDPADNNGFDRTHSALPTTDVPRMLGFFQAEFDRRGLTDVWAATIPQFGQVLLDQVNYAVTACEPGDGVDADGKLVWKSGQTARYVYVLEVGSKNPGIPPNFDMPAGTRWRIDVPLKGVPLTSGLAYGVVPAGTQQKYPTSGAPTALVPGGRYVLYVLYDVALPAARCIFTAN